LLYVTHKHRTKWVCKFNVDWSVHHKNILIYIQQDTTLHSLFYLETTLHVSGGTTTHHQERKQLYLQHLEIVTPLLLPAAIAAGSSHVSSKHHIIYISSNNDRHPVTNTFTPFHYTCRHFTSSHLNFTHLHFTTLRYTLIWFKILRTYICRKKYIKYNICTVAVRPSYI